MRPVILLSCIALAACSGANKNRRATESTGQSRADTPSLIDRKEVCEGPPAPPPDPKYRCEVSEEPTLKVTVPDDHWQPTETREYDFLIVHDQTGGTIGFVSSRKTAAALLAGYREQSRLDGETVGPTDKSKDGTRSWFFFSRTAGGKKAKITVRGAIAVYSPPKRPHDRIIVVGVWPMRHNREMSTDFLRSVYALKAE